MPRFLSRLLVFALVPCVLAAGTGWWLYALRPLPLEAPAVEVTVARGRTARSLGPALVEQGVPVNALLLEGALRLRGDAGRLRAGVFELRAPLTLRGLADALVSGEAVRRGLTMVEGWTFGQLRAALASLPDLVHDAAGLSDAEVLARIGADAPHPEGLFAPDTYFFDKGSSETDLLRRAWKRQQAILEREWAARRPDLPLQTPYEALVLASIVEKETGREADRPLVAAVFVNRLRRGMPLQSDPTTIYGLGAGFDGNLKRSHLRADTPWNTYVRTGLPPTPISLPGTASIRAVLDPPASRALYFVARGDGSSEFSETLDAHNRAVNRYQRAGNPTRTPPP